MRIGLVDKVVPDATVLEAARDMARQIAKQSRLAVRIAKLALNASGRPNPAFETLDILGQAVLFDSEDKRARMAAFLERRAKKGAAQ